MDPARARCRSARFENEPGGRRFERTKLRFFERPRRHRRNIFPARGQCAFRYAERAAIARIRPVETELMREYSQRKIVEIEVRARDGAPSRNDAEDLAIECVRLVAVRVHRLDRRLEMSPLLRPFEAS